ARLNDGIDDGAVVAGPLERRCRRRARLVDLYTVELVLGTTVLRVRWGHTRVVQLRWGRRPCRQLPAVRRPPPKDPVGDPTLTHRFGRRVGEAALQRLHFDLPDDAA